MSADGEGPGDRGEFFSADEAKAFGLVDEVFEKRPRPGEEGARSRRLGDNRAEQLGCADFEY